MIGCGCQAILPFGAGIIFLSDGMSTFLTGSTDCCQRLAVQEYILSQVMDLGCQKTERKDLDTADDEEDHQGQQGPVGIEGFTVVQDEKVESQTDSDKGENDPDEPEQEARSFEYGKDDVRHGCRTECKF